MSPFYYILCCKTGGNVSMLLALSRDLKELLLAQDEFRLPLSSVISKYQHWFEKKTLFDPTLYGFSSVLTLLEALPATVEVHTVYHHITSVKKNFCVDCKESQISATDK